MSLSRITPPVLFALSSTPFNVKTQQVADAVNKAHAEKRLRALQKAEQVKAQLAEARELGRDAARLHRSRDSVPYDPIVAPAEYVEWLDGFDGEVDEQVNEYADSNGLA